MSLGFILRRDRMLFQMNVWMLLSEINQKTDLTIELGLQTIHEKTAILINRCHSLDTFARMVEKLRKRKNCGRRSYH